MATSVLWPQWVMFPTYYWQSDGYLLAWLHNSPWASITSRAPPPPSMLTYFLKSSYISSWRINMSWLKILGRACRLRLIFTPCRSFLRIFWFFSIFLFASIKCVLNSLESISIWYRITFQLNTRYIHFVLSNFVRREKPTPPPSWNEQKKKCVPLKVFR